MSLAAVGLSAAYYHTLPVIPGVGTIGQTFFILDPEKSVGNQIIEANFDLNRTTPLLDYKLPDSFLFADNRKCYFSPTTRVANNVKDFQQRYADKFRVGGGLYSMVDSFNDEVRWAYSQMELFNKSISYSEIQCLLYNLQLNTAGSGNVKLSKWFIDEVEALPSDVDGENLLAYFAFFERFGDHVYTKCSMGGLINQFLATDYAYWQNRSISEIKELSEMAFMVGVDQSKKQKYEIDEDFLNASTIRPIKYYGGAYPEFWDNWSTWSQSVLGKGGNLVCTNWEAVPITEFLDFDHRVLAKKEVMKTALGLYLNKPMCNHIEYSKDRPRLAIMKISETYKCDTKAHESWWLVAGANSYNECLVSWAYLRGTGSKVIGLTQHMRTDYNKAGVCLRGTVWRDTRDCSLGKLAGSNVTFIMKEPSGKLLYEHIDATREPIDIPHNFKICPEKKKA